ncbi:MULTISPECIES: hypothetical protein [unclassified Bartonella]|uniref:hypothetical protein n=1 Tax=unclassified Bartonella TaxID=2645622 RepID=UPI0035D1018C
MKKDVFLAKLAEDFHDLMAEYGKKFLDSPTPINRKEQIMRPEKIITCHFLTRFKNTAIVCIMTV